MFRRICAAAGVLLLLVAGCSRVSPPASADSPVVAPAAQGQAQPAAGGPVLPDSARLFQRGDSEWEYHFDDGTTETHEWWLWDQARLITANAAGVIATWYFDPSGVFRRDPLGGPNGTYLRYLPPALTDGMAWSQTSGDAVVLFWLRKVKVSPSENYPGRPASWELQVLNRGRLQRFEFDDGRGISKASLLNPAAPSASYHKEWGAQARKTALPVSRADLLAQADAGRPFRVAESPPVVAIDPGEFQRELSALFKPALQVPGGPFLLPISSGQPPLLLHDLAGGVWERLEQPASPCSYGAVPDATTPYIYELCGRPAAFGDPQTRTMTLRVWSKATWGDVDQVWWSDGSKAAVENASGMRIDVSSSGEIRVEEAVWRHILTTTYTISSLSSDIKERRYSTPSSVAYPEQPEGVLEAAFYARWKDIRDEVPTYFATPSAAQSFLNLIPHDVTDLNPDKAHLGAVERITPEQAYRRVVKVTAAAPVSGQPIGFAVDFIGCCDGIGAVWGEVSLVRDAGGQWKIADLRPQFVQDRDEVKSIK